MQKDGTLIADFGPDTWAEDLPPDLSYGVVFYTEHCLS